MGWSDIDRQYNVRKSNLPLSLKGKVYKECILSAQIYGPKTWSLMKALERKLQSAQREMEIIMFGITWREEKSIMD